MNGLVTVFGGLVAPFLKGPDNALVEKSDKTIEARANGSCSGNTSGARAGITAEDFETKTKSVALPSLVLGIGLGF